MAVVADYMDGNCRVIFDDTYCVKTQAEIDKILNEVSDIYCRYYTRKAMADAKKENQKQVS